MTPLKCSPQNTKSSYLRGRSQWHYDTNLFLRRKMKTKRENSIFFRLRYEAGEVAPDLTTTKTNPTHARARWGRRFKERTTKINQNPFFPKKPSTFIWILLAALVREDQGGYFATILLLLCYYFFKFATTFFNLKNMFAFIIRWKSIVLRFHKVK